MCKFNAEKAKEYKERWLTLSERRERFVNVLSKMELDKLSIMYDGDKNRDATSKIRGFLFQDYVTIKWRYVFNLHLQQK